MNSHIRLFFPDRGQIRPFQKMGGCRPSGEKGRMWRPSRKERRMWHFFLHIGRMSPKREIRPFLGGLIRGGAARAYGCVRPIWADARQPSGTDYLARTIRKRRDNGRPQPSPQDPATRLGWPIDRFKCACWTHGGRGGLPKREVVDDGRWKERRCRPSRCTANLPAHYVSHARSVCGGLDADASVTHSEPLAV